MKIQVRTNPVFEEVELTLPYYCKGSNVKCHFWMVFSETESLHVVAAETQYPQIEIYSSVHALIDDRIKCTKEEFEVEYAATLAALNSKL